MTIASVERRATVQNVSWETYLKLRSEDPSTRMTYSNGVLEITTLSRKHEHLSKLIARMIETWTIEREIDMVGGGSATLKSDILEKGLEPDECFYVQSASLVLGREDVDLAIEPPPDLALEVEVTNPLVGKLPIYAAMGVPEVWHWKDEHIQILTLAADTYRPVDDSVALPGFPFEAAHEILTEWEDVTHTKLIRRFQNAMRSA